MAARADALAAICVNRAHGPENLHRMLSGWDVLTISPLFFAKCPLDFAKSAVND
jgi:hypothetical protein